MSSSDPAVRFVQTSNLWLDQFCFTGNPVSGQDQRMLIEAPFRAAERIFDRALAERADVILIAGGLFRRATPTTWGASFFVRQCQRLLRRGIQVLWVEPDTTPRIRWPGYLRFPANLRFLATRKGTSELLSLGQGRVCAFGSVDNAETVASWNLPDKTCLIGLTSEPAPTEITAIRKSGISLPYVARIGSRTAATPATVSESSVSSGTPQPRCLDESGVGTCSLVEIPRSHDAVTRRLLPVEEIGYRTTTIKVDEAVNWEGFRRLLHASADSLCQETSARCLHAHWQISGHGPVLERLMRPSESHHLVDELRSITVGNCSVRFASLAPEPDSVQLARWKTSHNEIDQLMAMLDDLAGEVHRATRTGTCSGKPHFSRQALGQARRSAYELLSEPR